jgi:ferredoxin
MVDTSMAAIKIVHDRPNCIGCKACEVIAPEFWRISPEDGKSDVLGSTKREDGWEELDIEDKDYELNLNAAQSCPVNVIHLVKKETGEQII